MPTATIADLVRCLERLAPPALAEPWDNTGLLLGDASRPLPQGAGVLLCIDLTEAVAAEAVSAGAAAVIAYHPPIFDGLKRLTSATPRERALLRLAEAGIAVYSPHTALDAVPGGVTEWLLGLACPGAASEPIQPAALPGSQCKVVVFIPADPGVVDRVRAAMSAAGAGVIGAYSCCSFSAAGAGTFLGGESTRPVVGQAGRIERVEELRLEMVCPEDCVPAVSAALRAAHPYEEPAFDVLKLLAAPRPGTGSGRIATLASPQPPSSLAERFKHALGPGPCVQLAARNDDPITRVAAVPGSGGSLLRAACAAGAQLFITGEMKHHEVLGALDKHCAVLLAGHTETERGYLPLLASRLGKELAGARPTISKADEPPLRVC